MTIKLLRIDALDCTKIQPPQGKHIIGRGKLLDCSDKRISREHGELLVDNDSISIKAMHQNPCFFMKKGSTDSEILRQGSSITLNNGDRFGLLPDIFWYEVLFYSTEEEQENNDTEKCTEEYSVEQDQTCEVSSNKVNDDSKVIDFNFDESLNNSNRPESPSLITTQNNETKQTNQNEPESPKLNQNEPELQSDNNEGVQKHESISSNASQKDATEPKQINEERCEPKCESDDGPIDTSSSVKRSHSPGGNDVKKIKTENVEVKSDPDAVKPGPSDQGPSANVAAVNGAPSNDKPNRPRERCMYGANCYRKNPQHLSQFSHPQDPDWGPGERGVCPYGVNCSKRDPRHFRDHDHPPGVLPPAQPGMQVVEKRGNIFFINAQTVNFYDDHFNVEDTDGDSVDYDYEF